MINNINYKRINDLIDYTVSLSYDATMLSSCLADLPSNDALDLKKESIHAPILTKYLDNVGLFKPFRNSNDSIPLDIYLNLYIATCLPNIKACANFKDTLEVVHTDILYKHLPQIHQQFEFIAVVYAMKLNSIPWIDLINGFNCTDWHTIYLLAEVLPLADANLDQLVSWLLLIVGKNERDGALGGVAKYLYEWITLNQRVWNEVEQKLPDLASNNHINRFLTPLLKGLHEKQQKGYVWYISQLEDNIAQSNAFNILYAIGTICTDKEEAQDFYYNLLLSKLNSNGLALFEFINLCSYFRLYRQELFSRIELEMPPSENPEILSATIDLLHNDEENRIDVVWKLDTSKVLFSKNVKDLSNKLNYYLISLANKDIEVAYSLFEFRLKIMAHLNMLETAFVHMVQKDVYLFQTKLINWLNQEDEYLHIAVRYVCSINSLGKSLYEIPAAVFKMLNVQEKLYVSYKMVGYVYSMGQLQRLLLSLTKSIEENQEVLRESMHYILSEYLVYNYRSSLQLMKDYLNENDLPQFAKELFEQIIEEYEVYFNQLNSITVDKELRPYKEHLLLKGFYMKMQFASIPKVAEKNSIASLFKNVQINSSKWAIRRPEQLKHDVQGLGHISVSTEFPSGEYLNPIYQENIRKTYQNIRKNEINFY